MNAATGFLKDIQSALMFLLNMINAAPFGVWAVVVGLICAWSLAAWSKRWIPKMMNRDFDLTVKENIRRAQNYSDRREFIIETVAFLGGFFGVWLPYQTRGGILLGILVGFSSSNVYTFLTMVTRPIMGWWNRYWENRK